MNLLLNSLYVLAMTLALPWIALARVTSGKSLQSWSVKFIGNVPRRLSNEPCVWFHAVSVGEVNALATVVKRFRQDYPDRDWIVSSTTDSGYALAASKFGAANVVYFPWDFSWSIHRFLDQVRPQCLVLTELEIWPNLISCLNQRKIPVAIINGRLSNGSFRGYSRFARFTRPIFEKLNLVIAQDTLTAHRFNQLGVAKDRIQVAGSVKFDGAITDRDRQLITQLRRNLNLNDQTPVFLAGSTQEGEDEIVIEAFRRARQQVPALRLILAPRHVHRARSIAQLVSRQHLRPRLRTELLADGNSPIGSQPVQGSHLEHPRRTIESELNREALGPDDVVILDTIGELADWWGLATMAFVGGSLGNRGGQNMLEPAALGCRVCFGPNTENFRHIVQLLLEKQAAQVVTDANGLAEFLSWSANSVNESRAMGLRAASLIREHTGATERTMNALATLWLKKPSMASSKVSPNSPSKRRSVA